jgi:hypothetical protein
VQAGEEQVTALRSTLYFKNLSFDGEKCRIALAGNSDSDEVVLFSFVRSFAFYKESDFYEEISKYEKRRLLRSDGQPSAAFQILKNPLLQRILSGRLDEEGPSYFGVWTPDECIEVVCFEEPTIA